MKHKAKIIVVIGNPPYDAFAGVAQAQEGELVAHYKGITLVDDIDPKSKQVRRDEFGHPKKKQKGQSALYLEYGVRKQLLDDLYVRFFRMAEERIGEAAEFGIVSYISNSSYLTGRSHPIMRKSLLSNFHRIWIDNLNGDKYRTGKLIPAGLPGTGKADQSAFTTEMDPRGIQPGTAIVTLVKRAEAKIAPTKTVVCYRDFWGLAKDKRAELIAALPSGVGKASKSYEAVQPTRENRWRLSPTMVEGGFEAWPALDELFPVNYQGVQPSRGLDGSVIDTKAAELTERMRRYFAASSFAAASSRVPELAEGRARYNPEKAWSSLKADGHFKDSAICPFLVFPFDRRFLYYSSDYKFLNEARREFYECVEDNEFFGCVFAPRKASEVYPIYSRELMNYHVHERGSYVFPRETRSDDLLTHRDANIGEKTWRILREHFGLKGERRDADACAIVGKLFRVGFAILHAPAYQAEHKSALSADWAHLSIPKDRKVFARLVDKGEQVTRLLDANRDAREVVEAVLGHERAALLGPLKRDDGGKLRPADLKINVTYWGSGKGRWKSRPFGADEAPLDGWGEGVWGDQTGDLYINDEAFFANVPEAVWTYQLGGYPVLKKWLGYRQADRRDDKPLIDDERKWFRQIVQRVAALLALGAELDALYQQAAANAFTATELGIER
ncbi:type ISP restriction/modification enzyme [Methylocystis sp.]|uniref:type ISP restriction/modification enzyme n=1 Tax=Methylocystis sp. TaxID=1911079 RepID=UPI0025F14EBC|nr:type ISP restriction/modification enzyme [Methylocystis sp.]